MAGIRSTNTKPELAIRHALHRRGFRYRLHKSGMAGKPDIVLRAYGAAIFVNGCFWHGHDCAFFRPPQTRPEFWTAKIEANRRRDATVKEALAVDGWRQLIIWECAIRGKKADAIEKVADRAARWITSKRRYEEIRGE